MKELLADWESVVEQYGYTEPTCLEVRTLTFVKSIAASILSRDSGEAVKLKADVLRKMAEMAAAVHRKDNPDSPDDDSAGPRNYSTWGAADMLEALSASAARLTEDNKRLRQALECGLEVTQIAINALGPNSLCTKELTATLTRHREALRLSPSPEEGQTWQPIADAPKDREIVYLWKSEGHVGRCRWSDEREWACWWDIDGDQEAHATHYIPMPSLRGKAPADGKEDGQE